MAEQDRGPDILVKYGLPDHKKARQLREALEAEGWRVILDAPSTFTRLRNVINVEAERQVKQALESPTCAVIILVSKATETYLGSSHLDCLSLLPSQKSLVSLQNQRKRLFKVSLDKGDDSTARVRQSSKYELFDWSGNPYDPSFRKLVSGLSEFLGKPKLTFVGTSLSAETKKLVSDVFKRQLNSQKPSVLTIGTKVQPVRATPDLFISYQKDDRQYAEKLAIALEKEGWHVWWDPQINPGDDFDEVIEKTLNDAKCVVVLWSQRSRKSRYVKGEARTAMDQGKLVPAFIENVTPPLDLHSIQGARIINWDGDTANSEFQKLVRSIKQRIQK